MHVKYIEELTYRYGCVHVHIHPNCLDRVSISSTDTARSRSGNKYAAAIRRSDSHRQRSRRMQPLGLLIDESK